MNLFLYLCHGVNAAIKREQSSLLVLPSVSRVDEVNSNTMADFLYFCIVRVLAALLCVVLIGGLISLVAYMVYMIFFCWRDKSAGGSLPWWVWWDAFRNHNR